MNKLGIIVPTMGRPTLVRTLASFADDVMNDDVVWILTDGPKIGVSHLVSYFEATRKGTWICAPLLERGCWGHPLRNVALDAMSTFRPVDYAWTIDDDDEAAPGALDLLRDLSAPWAIFKMKFGRGHPANGITCWRESVLRHGDIGTPMVVARPCNARFGLRYEGDWDYVTELNQELGAPEWRQETIAMIRP